MTTVVQVALADRPYPVVVGRGLFGDAPAHLPLPAGARRVLVVSQGPIVAAGHLDRVEAALDGAGLVHERVLVPDGEAAKHVEVLATLWDACAALPLERGDAVVAVGGGVVGDLAGFAAATYNRGIAVLQVPTTLLAQVDAAIGGKTGINLAAGKNLVGAFHQPVGVLCDVATLATVSDRVLREGLGEVVKYGLIRDAAVMELLEAAVDGADPHGPVRAWLTDDLLEELVRRSVAVKAAVVAADEREAGERAFLNLGHTYGHAVEALTGYAEVLHGEAVAIGTVVALRVGAALGRTPDDVVARGEALLAAVGLPTVGPRLDREAVWRVMARDKKAAGGDVRFVVLDDVAAPVLVTPERAIVDAVLDEVAA
ncbi:MAG: 3-dehydroquinate synthase [Nitriliruptoraceae bacterium]|nr:3-dehydroquinate synthase [Nitriliruptoraceae bacterium]